MMKRGNEPPKFGRPAWHRQKLSGQTAPGRLHFDVRFKSSTSSRATIIDAPRRLVMSLNVVTLVGRVGGDPETRRFESGNMKTSATLAVNRASKSDQPDWFALEFWGKQAETVEKYVNKGSLIGVKGSLKIETWTDKSTGVLRSKPVILVDRLDLLGSKRDSEAPMSGGGGGGGYEEDF
jgi:single-strand DNA-binding protein